MMGRGRRQLWSVTGFALLVFCAEAYQDEDHLTLPALNRVELDTMNQVKNEVFATAGIVSSKRKKEATILAQSVFWSEVRSGQSKF